jgi:hypothetical protein
MAIVDQFTILDTPVLRKFGSLFFKVRVLLFAREFRNAVWIQSVPSIQIIAIEQGAKTLRRCGFDSVNTRECYHCDDGG